MLGFLVFVAVVYFGGVAGVPVAKGLSPFEFPAWDWPRALYQKLFPPVDDSQD